MTTKTPKKRHHDSLSSEAETRLKRAKPTPLRFLVDDNKKYTQRELDDIAHQRQRSYDDLLGCARRNDTSVILLLSSAKRSEVPMPRVSYPLHVQVELLDIYHYLVKRGDLRSKVTQESFGRLIGLHLPGSTLSGWLRHETAIRKASKEYPEDAHYIVKRKNMLLEQVLYQWLQDQQKESTPVGDEVTSQAADVTYTILGDLQDSSEQTVSEVQPSFSVIWFDPFMKRHRITYCQLQAKAGSIDLEVIEPELAEIRHLCAQYTPDNIFNCDETGFYLTKLDPTSFTMLLSKPGVKAIRSCKVSALFCINASGSSLAMANSMESLKPLVIAESFPREIEEDPTCSMTMATTKSGWMTRDLFVEWLKLFDDELSQPILLLLDAANAHNNINMRDPKNNVPWKHLRIQQLPKNSTSVTQPLDAGVLRVFKQEFLELLNLKMHPIRNYDNEDFILNEFAWTLIPDAWSRVKVRTLRTCFAQTPVLPIEMREQLLRQLPAPAEQLPLQYPQHYQYNGQAGDFEHLIYERSGENGWKFEVIGNKDAQELAEEALQQMDANEDGERDQSEEVLTGEAASPPSPDEELYNIIQTVKKLGGERALDSVESFKEIRRKTEHQSGNMLELRKAMKQLVRACVAYKKEMDADILQHSDGQE